MEEIRVRKQIPMEMIDRDRRIICTEAIDSLEVALETYYAQNSRMVVPFVFLTVQIATEAVDVPMH